jgi:ribonucleotide reductase beta subunit family protein with ferritin-like domain
MSQDITYEEAKKAKEILLEYLKQYVNCYDEIDRNHTEKLVYLALTQEYFLD